MSHLVVVIGNIASGKSTLINQQFKDFIKLPERVETWIQRGMLQRYDEAIRLAQTGVKLSLTQQSHIVELQIIATLDRLNNFVNIDPNKNYVFERSIQESYHVFCQVLKQYLDDRIWIILDDFMQQAMRMEPEYDQIIQLHEEPETLIKRIRNRNREGEDNINLQYINQLQHYYDTFQHQQGKYDPPNNDGCTYVVGSVAVGKTTFIQLLENHGVKTVKEPLDYWGDNLERHLKNLEKYASDVDDSDDTTGDSDDMNNTFFFQLRVLTSRMAISHCNSIHERCVLEEQFIFVPQYKYLFSNSQYELIIDMYNYINQHVLKIRDQVIIYIDTSVDKQLQNLINRNRLNETTVYTREKLQQMGQRYEVMISSEIFQTIHKNGKFYRIKWE